MRFYIYSSRLRGAEDGQQIREEMGRKGQYYEKLYNDAMKQNKNEAESHRQELESTLLSKVLLIELNKFYIRMNLRRNLQKKSFIMLLCRSK